MSCELQDESNPIGISFRVHWFGPKASRAVGPTFLWIEGTLHTSRLTLLKLSKLIRSFLLVLAAGLLAFASHAQAQGGEAPAPRLHWSAQWISHPTAPLREPITLHFKKAI